jgi:beta-galactosidase/beta-glucuronidase
MLRSALSLLAVTSSALAVLPLHSDAFARSPEQRARILAIRETSRLRDVPPAGSSASQYLDGEDWVVKSADGVVDIEGFVPGDLITDLQLAGVMGDPIYDQNWLTWLYDKESAPLWDNSNFTYTKTFDADTALLVAGTVAQLTFDGVKMAADVSLNGVYLGFTNDMFLRTVFDVTSALRAKDNVLTVTFTTSSDPRNEAGRWPACSGG